MAFMERAITPILKKRVQTSKCLLVTGARQVGKSTLVKHEFSEYNRANFDDRLTRLQAKEEPKLFFLNHPCPLFIDEVQKENSILEDIKLIVDESDERGLFILSGSQKLELMKEMSESLAGRVSATELTGLSLREKNMISYDNLWKTIHKGSYPELYDVERDINELISADSITFTKFLTAVAARTGEMLNYANVAALQCKRIESCD